MTSTESLKGRVVLSSDGVVVGTISQLFVDQDWHIHAFEVRLRKEAAERAGIARRVFRAPTLTISTGAVQSTGDAVILSVPLAMLHQPASQPISESERPGPEPTPQGMPAR